MTTHPLEEPDEIAAIREAVRSLCEKFPGEYWRTLDRERGYPTDDFEQRAADISVEHPELVERYRTAHGIAQSNERGQASTEDLRQSVRHYRALFDELLGGGAADEPISRDQTTEEVEADDRARTRS